MILPVTASRITAGLIRTKFIRHSTILSIEIAVDLDRIPTLGVSYIVNGKVVVLAPKESTASNRS